MTATWDARLITRERAWALAGGWSVRPVARDGQVSLFCFRCGQPVTVLIPAGRADGYLVTLDGLVPAVLRHMVTHHGQSLSGGGNGRSTAGSAGTGQARPAARGPGPGHDGRGGDHLDDRPVDQAAGARAGNGPEGGDGG